MRAATSLATPTAISRFTRGTTTQTFKHTLLPVWLLHYDYGRRSFQVVVNGVTGAIAGEQPYSWIKIFFAALVLLILAIALISIAD